MTAKVLTRADLPDSDKWDLTHLFVDADKWTEDFVWLQNTYPRITEWKGRLGESAATLVSCLEFEKALDLKIERLSITLRSSCPKTAPTRNTSRGWASSKTFL